MGWCGVWCFCGGSMVCSVVCECVIYLNRLGPKEMRHLPLFEKFTWSHEQTCINAHTYTHRQAHIHICAQLQTVKKTTGYKTKGWREVWQCWFIAEIIGSGDSLQSQTHTNWTLMNWYCSYLKKSLCGTNLNSEYWSLGGLLSSPDLCQQMLQIIVSNTDTHRQDFNVLLKDPSAPQKHHVWFESDHPCVKRLCRLNLIRDVNI